MRQTLVSLLLFACAGCAATPRADSPSAPRDLVLGTRPEAAASAPVDRPRPPGSADRLDPISPSEAAAVARALAARDAATPAPPRDEDRSGRTHTGLALGAFVPLGDLDDLDTGFWGDITFGHRINNLLSIEPSVGYYTLSGNGVDVYGVPLLVEARLGIPVLILEPYLGAGAGGVWVHSKIPGAGSNDDFTYLWDAFAGLEVKLGGFRLGAEYKYVRSGDVGPVTQPPPSGAEFQLEGSVVSLTATLPF